MLMEIRNISAFHYNLRFGIHALEMYRKSWQILIFYARLVELLEPGLASQLFPGYQALPMEKQIFPDSLFKS